MAQVKVYALAAHLEMCRTGLSDVIHGCLVEALELPEEKRFQRFFRPRVRDFIFPADRSAKYTVLEIQMFEGRSERAKKRLIRLLFKRFAAELGYGVNDLEINLLETPRANWGVRGLPGDELALPYRVDL
jgi:phenylpyruvate tautomerase PptA (4-oxalocrotonate tautomerase family)